MSSPRVAYQLYSARVSCASDFEAVLRAIGAMGYDGVELAGLHGHDVTAVRAWLDAAGLAVCGAHISLVRLTDDAAGVVVEARALGTDRVILAYVTPPTTAAEADAFAVAVRRASDAVAEAGGRFAFHNHAAELVELGGTTTLDRLLAEPRLELELDLGWVWIAGVDPLALLARAAPGVPLVHVKDFRRDDPRSFCPVGEGAIGWASLLAGVAATTGVEWLVIEQDEPVEAELDEAARSLAFVRRCVGR